MQKIGKIVLLVPAPTAKGGISYYYESLRNELPQDVIFFERGARNWPQRTGFFGELKRIFSDFRLFRSLVRKEKISLVQSSTSLGVLTTLRDGIFLKYSQSKGIKTIAFFRGWDADVEKEIEEKYLKMFKFFFFSCDVLMSLSQHVKGKLQSWGFEKEIFVETTLVDKTLLSAIGQQQIVERHNNAFATSNFEILFMSRIEQRKGIYECLSAFSQLQEKYRGKINFKFNILGDGFERDSVEKFIEIQKIENVFLPGFIKGDQKGQYLKTANIFLFPSYGEGMPNAVLEAMAAGVVTITTPVGGLVDFFMHREHGLIVAKPDAGLLVDAVEKVLFEKELSIRMAIKAHNYAKANFFSDAVAGRLMKIFNFTIRK
ncbi:MAG: glycosyltransferase family 4 protein [Ignavibacteria bacterium]|nr:glycosyltransferase family 4 protein [Ignavibacteria bacterium]